MSEHVESSAAAACGCTFALVNGFWLRNAQQCAESHQEEGAIMEQPKAGWKTTEFWLAAAAAVVALVQSSGAIAAGSAAEGAVGLVAAALASLGYSWSRAKAKNGG